MKWLEDEGLSPREERLRIAFDPKPSEVRRLARTALEEGRSPRSRLYRRRALAVAGALALVLVFGVLKGPDSEEEASRLGASATVESPVAVKLGNSGNVVTITTSSGQIEALVARGGS